MTDVLVDSDGAVYVDVLTEEHVTVVDVTVPEQVAVTSVTAGMAGPPGPPGTHWYTGNGPPGVIDGADPGDLYLDMVTGAVWTLE